VSGIAVVHLVRERNGLAPFERFLKSYREHAAGAAHELVLLFKGFRPYGDARAYDRLIGGLPHRHELIPDAGFDLHAYFRVAATLGHDEYCFLNSFSRVLAPDWLAKLRAPFAARSTGLVGATGSWESFAALSAPKRWITQRYFDPFPNPHLRTNAIIASREVLARIALPAMRLKFFAHAFESGKGGLTAQVRTMGREVLVVDRHGSAFTMDGWHLSNTFRQSRQEDLLVADNQTDAYAAADAVGRARLSRLAWGERARPG
jgi:hypothetical protein